MAAPTIRAVGTVSASNSTISPGLPAGTAVGDLLVMFVESFGAVTVSGWTQLLDNDATGTHLIILYRVATGTDPTTSDTVANHAVGRIVGITTGTYDSAEPFNATQTNDQTSTQSVSISGAVTDVVDTLILAATAGDLPDSGGTTEFSSWANANLADVTERVDNTTNQGNGGALGVMSGTWASTGNCGASTVTAVTAAVRANAAIAIAPLSAPSESGGSTSTVDVIATGAGVKKADDGVTSNVDVIATGAGSKASSGGSTAMVDVVATGDGTAGTVPWWQKILVAPTASSGLTTGDYTAVDEDPPWSDADTATMQVAGSGSGDAIFSGFDLSQGPGDKKGFRIWARMRVSNAAGFELTVILKATATTLWTSPTATITNTADQETYVIEVPDSAFSGDPDIDDLNITFHAVNNLGSANNLIFAWMRLSKSPFTAAEEATLPAALAGQDFGCYRASDLAALGAVEDEAVVLWPDASGAGRHLVRRAGTFAAYKAGTPDFVLFSGTSGSRLVGARGWDMATEAPDRITGNMIQHAYIYPIDNLASGDAGSIISVALGTTGEFADIAGVTDKQLLAYQDEGAGDEWVIMDGDGTAAAHEAGGTVVHNAWIRLTHWIQDAGNDHLWENDDASPVIDAAGSASSNDHYAISVGDRETDNRAYGGRIAEIWLVDGDGITEGDIDDARDEWVNGPGVSGGSTANVDVVATGAGRKAADEGVTSGVDVVATGAGVKKVSGGSTATVTVTGTGSGRKATSGSATAGVDVLATGTGRKAVSGGSTAGVDVIATGDGSVAGPGSGGMVAFVDVVATGAGVKATSGAGTAGVDVVGTGAGVKAADQGSTANVDVVATGAGRKAAAGGSTAGIGVGGEGGGAVESVAIVEVIATGNGAKAASGGSTAVVVVDATGDGTEHDPLGARMVRSRYQNLWCRNGPHPMHWPTRRTTL